MSIRKRADGMLDRPVWDGSCHLLRKRCANVTDYFKRATSGYAARVEFRLSIRERAA